MIIKSTMPMETKDKWLKALRSGEYKQTTGSLCDGKGGYCCLGVLQMALDGEVEHETLADGKISYQPVPTEAWVEKNNIVFGKFMPDTVINTNPDFIVNDPDNENEYYDHADGVAYCSAAGLNDTAGYTFEQIADLIEAQVAGI